MAKLIYTTIASLDGYIADEQGNFEWATPSEEVHAFVNDVERSAGTHLYGRRMYEVMAVWEDPEAFADHPVSRDFGEIWRAADKIVFSKTLAAVSSTKTRIERNFDPEAIRQLKARSERDLTVGGPGLAAHAFAAGLVDEVHVLATPVLVGGGTQSLPPSGFATLELLDLRRFDDGVVHLHYRVDA